MKNFIASEVDTQDATPYSPAMLSCENRTMIKTLALAVAAAWAPACAVAQSAPLRIASWNLGWHVSMAELPAWIGQCARSFKKNTATGHWDVVADGTAGSTVGWFVKESRATLEGVDLSRMPPCGVYQDASFKGIAVTPSSYANRMRQISGVLQGAVKPDLIAFQEVSGEASVREALGPAAAQYSICSFDGLFKVQRLAFAWRKELGEAAEPCAAIASVSLPEEAEENQVRPALTLGLRVQGKLVRFMTVHLKSSCVSPLDRGKLDGANQEACKVLQRQLRPLEAAVEALATGADHIIVLGDFNRNLWHEAHEVAGAEVVRSSGERDLSTPFPAGQTSRNLFKEVFDGSPDGAMSLVPLACGSGPGQQSLCDAAKTRVLTRDETRTLANAAALGCRNPVGLDHFVVSAGLQSAILSAEKIPLGRLGGSRSPHDGRPDPLLAVSDHCSIVLTLGQ